MSYVYIRSEQDVYTVGFYRPHGEWEAESDFNSREEAAKRVNYLNGGPGTSQEMQDKRKEAEAVRIRDVAYYMALPYHRVFVREAQTEAQEYGEMRHYYGYSASIQELPGVYGQGDSIEEANISLEASMRAWLNVCMEDDIDIPEPQQEGRTNIPRD